MTNLGCFHKNLFSFEQLVTFSLVLDEIIAYSLPSQIHNSSSVRGAIIESSFARQRKNEQKHNRNWQLY